MKNLKLAKAPIPVKVLVVAASVAATALAGIFGAFSS